jgi:hypothetical protein
VLRRSLVVLALLAAVACQRSTEPRSAAADPLAGLTLDAGKRWLADDHTRKGIAALRGAVRAAAADASPQATAALGKRLQDLGDQLIAGCTMAGPAHDALHHYLGILLPGIHRMTENDANAARQARQDVAVVLDRFGGFFE